MKSTQWISLMLAFLLLMIIGSAISSTDKEAFVQLYNDNRFARALLFSLQTSMAATLLAAIIGIPAGAYLARNNGWIATILDALFDIPIVMPPLIIGVLLLSFFNLPVIKEVYEFIFTMPGAIAAQFFIAVPFTIRAARSGFRLIPPVYEQIAMTLGASPLKAFWDTTLRLASPAIMAGIILSWLRCLGEFGATLMVGGGMPGRTENIPIYIYLNMSSGDFNKGIAAALVAIFLAFCGIVFIRIFTSFQKDGFHQG